MIGFGGRLAVSIPLKNSDGDVVATALVDHADESLLREYRWKLNNGYASRYDRNSGSAVVMHRQIMGLAKGDPLVVDHINGKRLDNRRANLRVITAAENSQNTPSRRGAASRYRNVFWNTRTGKWTADVTISGTRHFLGYFDDELAAHEAVSQRRVELASFANEDRCVRPSA